VLNTTLKGMSGAPAMPAFSYAQAAKGLAPSTSQLQPAVKTETSDQAQQSKPAPKQDSQAQTSQKSSRSNPRVDDKETTKSSKVASAAAPEHEDVQDKESIAPTRRPQQKQQSSNASPRLAADTASPKDSNAPPARSDSWDIPAAAEKDSASSEKAKEKDTEDDWEKVSIPSMAAEKELRAAPIPSVNVWHIRAKEQKEREAQKATIATAGAQPSAIAAKQPEEQKRKGNQDRDTAVAHRSQTKPNERTDVSSSQSSRPASRSEKLDASALVSDATSWPTPDTVVEERKKSTQAEKADKSDGRASSKGQGKNWVQMPFVPTAKFETPLPPSMSERATKRTAQNRRGRDGAGRGGHNGNGNGDRHDASTRDQDRGRKTDANRGGRASSLPAGNPSNQGSEETQSSIRKPSVPVPASKDGLPAQAPTAAPFVPAAVAAVSEKVDSQSSRHNEGGLSSAVDSQTHLSQVPKDDVAHKTASPGREASEKVKASQPSNRPNDHTRSERTGAGRKNEWSREKSDSAREKVESWRDREYSGEGSVRRDRGSERGRGGYRGRGNHSYNPAGHPYTSPLPQNGFDYTKPNNGEPRPRQTSQPYPAPVQGSQGRNNTRTQSIPVGMMYPGQGFYNISGMAHALSLQTDIQGYGMPNQMAMQQGIMSAMPYNESLGSYAILSMVNSQMEYYFSIDNLCKDLYLRKNMDSQGWVLLSVVADFKRIKQLTGNEQALEMLRYVCPQVKNLQYMRGEDGEERIRRQDGWQDFVLPMADRFEAAQHDGPTMLPEYTQYQGLPHGGGEAMPFIPDQMHVTQGMMPPMNGMYSGPGSPPSFNAVPPFDGSTDSRPQTQYAPSFEARRESATSPLSQDGPGRKPSAGQHHGSAAPAVNGHHRSASRTFEESIFPDDKIADVHILKRDRSENETNDANDTKPAMPTVERTLSNDSETSASRFSALRGGLPTRKPSDQ
jgi:la-related protein 1